MRRMPQCSSACEMSVVAYEPRGVVGAPSRFESVEAIVRSWSRSSSGSPSRKTSSFDETVSIGSPTRMPAASRMICTTGK